jgi:putative sigma-54 modulation protein
MLINIESLHFKADDALADYIQERVDSLTKMFNRIESIHVILKKEDIDPAHNRQVEIIVEVRKKQFFVEATADTFELAVNRAFDKVKRVVRKHAERVMHI